MSLSQEIEKQLTQAMKEKNESVLVTMRMLKSAMTNRAIELMKKELTDEETISVIRGEIKKRDDSIEAYQAGGRQDLVEQETREKELLKAFLPPAMSAEEIKSAVEKAMAGLAEADKKNFGKAMALAMNELKGKADGKAVSQAVKELLTQ
ncbi:GatB/YqeY domain-containing protein [Candidatus Falkowbacteria bacterium]|nr:GatB/YqeY domain-containing protein [Candidatus Falkowbacteria bacterium]